jgi:NADPH:quinone reductase-like Zn-dependent oxidoreductase
VLRKGGQLVSIVGPPDVAFAKLTKLNPFFRIVMWMLSRVTLKKAKARGVGYSFLFMRADGAKMAQIATLMDAGAIRPVVDRVFPFAQTPEALAHVETGRANGKVVIKVAD